MCGRWTISIFRWVSTTSVLNYGFLNCCCCLSRLRARGRDFSSPGWELLQASARSEATGEGRSWWQALDNRMSCLAVRHGNPTEQRRNMQPLIPVRS